MLKHEKLQEYAWERKVLEWHNHAKSKSGLSPELTDFNSSPSI